MRKTLVALMLVPAVALAQGSKNDAPQARNGFDPARVERAEKRMRLARTLGLAEALDLDTAAALRLGEQLAKFDERRKAVRRQAADSRDVLRTAARGGKATAAEVDAAIARLLEARAQMQALDREMLQAITKDLSPGQKARAALFLGTFRDRIERKAMRFHRGPGGGPDGGPGWHPHGRRGMGPGPGGPDDPRMTRGAGDGSFAAEDMPPFAEDFEED